MRNRKSGCKKQTFKVSAPGAVKVQLAGDFTQWDVQPICMLQERPGTWKATIELAPGTYHYRFIVDGHWQDDPNCAQWVANPFGTRDAIRQIN
jgi:1,4-alpha-glucan branching enzyme